MVCIIACVSACEEMDDGPIQTGDGCGEPSAPYKVILATAPASQDVECEARSAFCERPSRAHLRGGNPVRKRSAFGTRRPRGRLKCRWRVLCEFGTDGSACGHVCEAPRAAYRVFCSRNTWTGSTGRYSRAGLHGKAHRVRVRVTSSARTSRRELQVNSAHRLAWRTPRK